MKTLFDFVNKLSVRSPTEHGNLARRGLRRGGRDQRAHHVRRPVRFAFDPGGAVALPGHQLGSGRPGFQPSGFFARHGRLRAAHRGKGLPLPVRAARHAHGDLRLPGDRPEPALPHPRPGGQRPGPRGRGGPPAIVSEQWAVPAGARIHPDGWAVPARAAVLILGSLRHFDELRRHAISGEGQALLPQAFQVHLNRLPHFCRSLPPGLAGGDAARQIGGVGGVSKAASFLYCQETPHLCPFNCLRR